MTLSTGMILAWGCDRTPRRVVTSGKVLYQGELVANGQIQFVPDTGPSVQGPIQNGLYILDYKGGVMPGEARVEILAYVMGTPDPDDKFSDGSQQVIPKEFNQESKLRRTIVPGRPNSHDFSLPE